MLLGSAVEVGDRRWAFQQWNDFRNLRYVSVRLSLVAFQILIQAIFYFEA